jgi:hypothetical protein
MHDRTDQLIATLPGRYYSPEIYAREPAAKHGQLSQNALLIAR